MLTDPVTARNVLTDPKRCPRDLRDFVWRHLYYYRTSHLQWQQRMSAALSALTINANGTLIAVAAPKDEKVLFYDLKSGQKTAEMPVRGMIYQARFSPRDELIAVALTDRPPKKRGPDRTQKLLMTSRIELWNTKTLRRIRTIATRPDEGIYSIKFSPEGRRVFAVVFRLPQHSGVLGKVPSFQLRWWKTGDATLVGSTPF